MSVLGELFDFFMSEPARMPEDHYELSRQQPIHRVVCDYLAGMTDGFCVKTHQQWLSPRGS
jgi:dGTPase